MRREWSKRTTDQRYSGCSEARANKHEDIASWEPSYREHMDGDGDGLACEPYR
ncbi:excalibur calcium-binding domain-containing protein [Brevundimonas sp.]|uniref:excalibur calcium-binding domain-containing protein n=1 Tax=Brevundimonas sp. TaxID=1871086 RepID=UPI0039181F18